jgi:parvulin-like peptidyl-prolyl isomerase
VKSMGKNKGKFEDDESSSTGAPIKGGKMRASHILVKKLGMAQQIADQLKAGGDFKALAKQYSDCPSAKKGGDLGEFGKEKMVPEFWNGTVKLKIGEVSQPIKTQFGYHLIKRTG